MGKRRIEWPDKQICGLREWPLEPDGDYRTEWPDDPDEEKGI